jgi:hypothetical protein
MMMEGDMRYSKFSGRETPKAAHGMRGRWYDLREFLELEDLHKDERPAPRPPAEPPDPLASTSAYVPHTLGHPTRGVEGVDVPDSDEESDNHH